MLPSLTSEKLSALAKMDVNKDEEENDSSKESIMSERTPPHSNQQSERDKHTKFSVAHKIEDGDEDIDQDEEFRERLLELFQLFLCKGEI